MTDGNDMVTRFLDAGGDPNVAMRLRDVAMAVAQLLPADLAHVGNAEIGTVARDEMDRWRTWNNLAEGVIVAAADGNALALRAAMGPASDDEDDPGPDWRHYLCGAAMEIEHDARPLDDRARSLAQSCLFGWLPRQRMLTAEVVDRAREVMAIEFDCLLRDGHRPDDVDTGMFRLDEYEARA